MEANLLRSVGIAVGAAALAGALAIATLKGDPEAPAADIPPPAIAGPMAPAPPEVEASEPTDPTVFETADAGAAPPPGAPLTFLVRFQGSGPLARAQHLALEGREAEARSAAQSALLRQSSLRGLCFDRFTVGGAEMVLRLCEAPPESGRAQATARWLARLRDMPAVAYADTNSTAAPARTP